MSIRVYEPKNYTYAYFKRWFYPGGGYHGLGETQPTGWKADPYSSKQSPRFVPEWVNLAPPGISPSVTPFGPSFLPQGWTFNGRQYVSPTGWTLDTSGKLVQVHPITQATPKETDLEHSSKGPIGLPGSELGPNAPQAPIESKITGTHIAIGAFVLAGVGAIWYFTTRAKPKVVAGMEGYRPRRPRRRRSRK